MALTYCNANNGAGSTCMIAFDERCNSQGGEVNLYFGNKIHHVYISQNSTVTDTTLYVPTVSMPASLTYSYDMIQTGVNPSTWQTQEYIYVCGGFQTPAIYDFTSGADQPDWAQGCFSGPCSLAANCVTIQTIDFDGNPVSGFPIETDLAVGATVTDMQGYAYFTGVQSVTPYDIFGDTISFPGTCIEYLVTQLVGICEFTPTINCICGCDDPAADNYDATANYYNFEDCPCTYPTLGCMDTAACNYDASATSDDNSCVYPGCTDPDALNYDSSAGCDDGSCVSQPSCDTAYGENNPTDNLTDVDVKRIETEARFADNVYKHFQARRYGMTSPCETSLDGIASEKYLCFWEDKKEKEYTGFNITREVFKPLIPGTPPAAGTYPAWVDPLCGLISKGQLTVYFYYDGTSMGVQAVKDAHATTELWMQSLIGLGFTGSHYHTIVNGERWLDWGTSAITGIFNNAGTNTSTTLPCSNPNDPSCGPGRPCGGCGVSADPNDGITGACQCSGWAGGKMSRTLKVQDNFQNGDCPTHFYDAYTKNSVCNTWVGTDGWAPKGPIVTWQGMAPPAATEQVLVVCFADETEIPGDKINNDVNFACYHGRGSTTGVASDWNLATISGVISPAWKADYNKYIEIYNEFEGRSCNHSLNCYIYPSLPVNVSAPHRPFPLHAIGAVTSGNRPVQDGTYLTNTAPVNTMSNTSIAAIELPGSNLYWNEPNTVTVHSFGYGGLDNYGWGGTFTSAAFTQEGFTSDLNNFFTLSLYECNDNECLIFDVVNQNGVLIEDYEIILDGKDVGKTNSFGRYTHIITKASINTEHTAQLCECFTTSGSCAQQRLLITASEKCPTAACTVPSKQCTCNAPGNLQVVTSYNSTLLNWSPSISTETTITYDIRYRAVNVTTPNTWIEITSVASTSYTITGLLTFTEYEFQVRSKCGTIISDWNATQTFTTITACPIIDCLLSSCATATSYTLGYNYTSIGELDITGATGTNGVWGVIWGTNADLEIGNIVNGGSTSTTMVPGTASTYPGDGIVNTLITETATGLTPNTYYWRAYITITNMPNCLESQYSDVCTYVTPSSITNPPSQCLIPDNNFEQALMDIGLKSQGAYTGSIDFSAVNTVTTLNVSIKGITDLTGIECFTALQSLDCSVNSLTSLNLVANTALTFVNCGANQLTSLNVTANTALLDLRIYANSLPSLDITNNTALTTLYGANNLLTSIDVSNNTALISLSIHANQLTALDVSANTALTILSCGSNQIVSLDCTTLVNLVELACENNPPMNFLDVTNGNNSNMPMGDFIANNTPSLMCISVDNVAYSNTNWPAPLYTDVGDTYNNPCVVVSLCTIPDSNFRNALDINQPQLAGQWVNTNQIDQALLTPITVISVLSSGINDFTGIECFTGCTSLNVAANSAPTINLTSLVLLKSLRMSSLNQTNSLTGNTIDLSNNVLLTFLECENNQLATINLTANTALEDISVGQNNLTSLDVTTCVSLTRLKVWYNQLTSINLGFNVVLDELNVQSNNLTTLSLTNNVLLTTLKAFYNNLTTLDLTTNTILEDASISYNNIAGSLDLSNNVLLEWLIAAHNNLTSVTLPSTATLILVDLENNDISQIDTSNNAGLETLKLTGNQLECLDVSSNVVLTQIYCQFQRLGMTPTLDILNLANGNNTNMTDANVRIGGFGSSNPNINGCVTVDAVAYATTNWTTWVDFGQIFNLGCAPLDCGTSAPMTYIPDNAFESYLTATYNIAFPIADHCLTSDISGITALSMNNLGITDLTGLQDFTAVTSIAINDNTLTNTFLNLTGNIALTHLYCDNANIVSINVTQCSALLYLGLGGNQITTIDLTNNLALTGLNFINNQFTTLDVSVNTALTSINVSNNLLTSIDVSTNTLLQYLTCSFNQLTSLDVSNNTTLYVIKCQNNSLTSLDASNSTTLTWLQCENNQLTTLNVKNGNNSNMSTSNFITTNNPNLICIDVDNVSYSTTNWTNIDATSSFSLSCISLMTYIPDSNFQAGLTALYGIAFPIADHCLKSDISSMTALDVSNMLIADLTGIADFTALTNLGCYDNQLTSLDVSQNTNLLTLFCYDNQITSLDVSNNTALTHLYCYDNQLISLNVSSNTALQFLRCRNNSITTLDVSTNTALIYLDCLNNQLTSLNIKNTNNANMLVNSFLATSNLLTTILCDNPGTATTTFTVAAGCIDAGVTFI